MNAAAPAEVFGLFHHQANVHDAQRRAEQHGWLLLAHPKTGALVLSRRPITGFRVCNTDPRGTAPEAA